MLEIELDKGKVMKQAILSFGFVTIGFINFTDSHFNSEFVKTISILGIFFFGMTGIYAIGRLFDKRPGIIIDEEGIVDNSNAASVGFIKWRNIKGISITQFFNQQFLALILDNPKEVLLNQNPFKKFLLKQNELFFHSPVQISTASLNCKFEELFAIVQKQLKKQTTF